MALARGLDDWFILVALVFYWVYTADVLYGMYFAFTPELQTKSNPGIYIYAGVKEFEGPEDQLAKSVEYLKVSRPYLPTSILLTSSTVFILSDLFLCSIDLFREVLSHRFLPPAFQRGYLSASLGDCWRDMFCHVSLRICCWLSLLHTHEEVLGSDCSRTLFQLRYFLPGRGKHQRYLGCCCSCSPFESPLQASVAT